MFAPQGRPALSALNNAARRFRMGRSARHCECAIGPPGAWSRIATGEPLKEASMTERSMQADVCAPATAPAAGAGRADAPPALGINQLPRRDISVDTTGCCPRFDPTGWDDRDLHFRDKLFVKASARSLIHVPVDMGRVFARVQRHIDEAGAGDDAGLIVLSRDASPWRSEHLFSVSKPVPAEEMTMLSGDFITQVFEGPYRKAKDWYAALVQRVKDRHAVPGEVYFFYTTCPKCARAYGKNYVVGVAALDGAASAA
jgi:hypothetical protein